MLKTKEPRKVWEFHVPLDVHANLYVYHEPNGIIGTSQPRIKNESSMIKI